MTVQRLACGVVFLFLTALAAEEPPRDVASAIKVLETAKLPTEGPALLQFFKARTLTEAERATLADTIKKLGSDDFEEREQASADLARAGIAALPLLRTALRDTDPEVVRRAERALDTLDREHDPNRLLAASRVLLDRNPAGSIEVLLGYLPTVLDDELLFEGVLTLITAKIAQTETPDPAVMAGLISKDPLRRIIAGRVVISAQPKQRDAVRKLIDDPDPGVRYQIASNFLRSGDKTVMPQLLKLLTEGPVEFAFRVEDMLCQLSDGQPPSVTLSNGDDETRRKCRESWETWWKDKGAMVDVAKLVDAEPLKGLTLVVEVDNNGGFNSSAGRIWECGPDGKQRWEMTNVGGPVDVQVLPGGRFLVAEYYTRRVTERDRTGKILWDSNALTGNPVSCQRLSNGNTLIATMNEIIELTPDHKKVGTFPRPAGTLYHARKGKNGNTYYLANNQIFEIDSAGKQVRAINVGNTSGWSGFELLPNGHFLVAYYVTSNRVAELDSTGKVIWEVKTPTPTRAQRLRNGNTLVAGGNQAFVIEYDRNMKEVWKVATRGRPFSVLRY